jgi:hypothetical protein
LNSQELHLQQISREYKRPSPLTSPPSIKKLSCMVPCSIIRAIGAAIPHRRRAFLSLIAGSAALLSAGCSHLGLKSSPSNPPTEQQLEVYAQQQTDLRRDVSHPNGESQEHCDQLATAAPGVEELRINQGVVESRQWTIVANGSEPQWTYLRAQDSSTEGWAPKPGLDKLDFPPPLEPVLATHSSLFLAYAPIDNYSASDSQRSATVSAVFGAAQGNFIWRGRKYSYTLTPDLPCFARPQ